MTSESGPAPLRRRFRFAGVEVDAAAHRVRVDGIERNCPRLAFNLLLQLCEHPGRVHPREELTAHLWPGGQVVSDESLTQAIFRLRAALGAYEFLLVTVRGVGLRLDAQVQLESERSEPVAATAETPGAPEVQAVSSDIARAAVPDPASAPNAARARTRATRRTATALAALALVFTIAIFAAWLLVRDVAWVERGHGVREGDAHASTAATIELLRSAFRAEASGDRAKAIDLLESAHRSDQRTPIPATFLALWAMAAGDDPASHRWFEQARARAVPLRDPYVDLLRDYARAEIDGNWNGVMSSTGALLELRPEAWRFRTARSHMLMSRGMREAALKELQAIEVPALDDRKLEMAVADRASLGDVAGAEAIVARLEPGANPTGLEFTRARIAYSRGDIARARAGFARAVELGLANNRLDVATRAQLLAGLLAMELGDAADARTRLADASARLVDRRQLADVADLGLVAVQLEVMAGDAERAERTLAQLRTLDKASVGTGAMFDLFALRLFGKLAVPVPIEASSTAPRYEERGLAALLAARRERAAGRDAAARTMLVRSRDEGVYETRYADEARLLAAELAEDAPPAAPLDPPFPPWARFASRWALAQHLATHTDRSQPPIADRK